MAGEIASLPPSRMTAPILYYLSERRNTPRLRRRGIFWNCGILLWRLSMRSIVNQLWLNRIGARLLLVQRRVVNRQAFDHPLEGAAIVAIIVVRSNKEEVENISVIHRARVECHALVAPVNRRAALERRRQAIAPGELRFPI